MFSFTHAQFVLSYHLVNTIYHGANTSRRRIQFWIDYVELDLSQLCSIRIRICITVDYYHVMNTKRMNMNSDKFSEALITTVCPGSSDPPEIFFNIFASENEVYTIY